jgi:hypothetical protein
MTHLCPYCLCYLKRNMTDASARANEQEMLSAAQPIIVHKRLIGVKGEGRIEICQSTGIR